MKEDRNLAGYYYTQYPPWQTRASIVGQIYILPQTSEQLSRHNIFSSTQKLRHIIHTAHPHQYNVYRGYVHASLDAIQKGINRGDYVTTRIPPTYLFTQKDGRLAFEIITAEDAQIMPTTSPEPPLPTTSTLTLFVEEEEGMAKTPDKRSDLRLWSKIMRLIGGDFYHLAHIDKEVYDQIKEEGKC
jgi:hypothetical protein